MPGTVEPAAVQAATPHTPLWSILAAFAFPLVTFAVWISPVAIWIVVLTHEPNPAARVAPEHMASPSHAAAVLFRGD